MIEKRKGEIMPTFPPLLTDTLLSIVTIGYGVRWECHYTAWISVFMNLIFTIFFLGGNDLPFFVYIALFVFLSLGIIVLIKGDKKITSKVKVKTFYPVFGSKTFGSLTLTAAFATLNWLGWARTISKGILGFFNSSSTFLAAWIIFALVFHILGFALFGRKKDKK